MRWLETVGIAFATTVLCAVPFAACSGGPEVPAAAAPPAAAGAADTVAALVLDEVP